MEFIGEGNIQNIVGHLDSARPEGKIEFSIDDAKLGLNIKKELKNLGRSVRYIEPKNTATILHNKLVEKKSDLTIIDNEVYFTVAIQLFEEMAERDFGRPGSDDKSGMLPPKLAKIMINLSGIKKDDVLLDPFCGSGTILTEALTMGYTTLIGSDISEKAITDSKRNTEWIAKNYELTDVSCKLYVEDATKLTKKIDLSSIDAIVTEPYLGKPLKGNETKIYLKKQTEELKLLYLNAFKEFYKILKAGGVVVIIIPKFKFNNDWVNIEIASDTEKIGFETVPFGHDKTLAYFRPNQHLAREIWRFKKTG